MTNSLERRTELFIIRIWSEYLTRDPPSFRGEVEHVTSNKKFHFKDMKELNNVLIDCTDKLFSQSTDNNN